MEDHLPLCDTCSGLLGPASRMKAVQKQVPAVTTTVSRQGFRIGKMPVIHPQVYGVCIYAGNVNDTKAGTCVCGNSHQVWLQRVAGNLVHLGYLLLPIG